MTTFLNFYIKARFNILINLQGKKLISRENELENLKRKCGKGNIKLLKQTIKGI